MEARPIKAAARKATSRGAVAGPCTRPPPEVTYSSRGSQLLAGLARGVQTDIVTPANFLAAGIFTLGGDRGKGQTIGEALWSAPTA